MSLTLTSQQRTILLFLSASAYTAWFSGVGDRLDAQGFQSPPPGRISAVSNVRPLPIAAYVQRDPFDSSSARTPAPASKAGARSEAQSPPVAPLAGSEVVVPNIETGGATTSATPLALVVRATIVGRNAVAYVASGSTMDIVRVGDTLGDRRVAGIDLRGVLLDNGARLDLPGAFSAVPQVPPRALSIALRLDDLRRLLVPQTGASPGPAASATAGATPTAPGTAIVFPSPGPLPTVNRSGYPPGVTPSTNPNDPTPYPNPYPYAPAR